MILSLTPPYRERPTELAFQPDATDAAAKGHPLLWAVGLRSQDGHAVLRAVAEVAGELKVVFLVKLAGTDQPAAFVTVQCPWLGEENHLHQCRRTHPDDGCAQGGGWQFAAKIGPEEAAQE